MFDRENPGFDAFVGNPPFAGKNAVAAGNVGGYPDWLKTQHEESHGNADLVAHFFRRAFDLVRAGGTFGLIATNTIAQGDTRSSGLRWICEHGGEIYRATKRYQWPGEAAVVVSVLHVAKMGEARDERTGSRNVEAADSGDRHATGRFPGRRVLDGAKVDAITAFLFHRGGHADPVRLQANAGKSFVGSYVLGMGFTFDDTDKKGIASLLAEMQRLIELEPRNREVIFPYVGGEEVNTSPTHAHHRYVINFRDWPLRRADRQAQASKMWTPGSADILSAANCTQPTDLTTFLSACPAWIPDFLLAVLAVTSGFRSSFRDWAAERTHTPHAVMEAALAQTIRSKVEAAYARRIRRPSRSTRSLTTVSPPRPGLRTATRRPSAAGSSGSAQT